ncbi:MAG: hypothetical protein AAF471_09015 [Myxococcota bacterium]
MIRTGVWSVIGLTGVLITGCTGASEQPLELRLDTRPAFEKLRSHILPRCRGLQKFAITPRTVQIDTPFGYRFLLRRIGEPLDPEVTPVLTVGECPLQQTMIVRVGKGTLEHYVLEERDDNFARHPITIQLSNSAEKAAPFDITQHFDIQVCLLKETQTLRTLWLDGHALSRTAERERCFFLPHTLVLPSSQVAGGTRAKTFFQHTHLLWPTVHGMGEMTRLIQDRFTLLCRETLTSLDAFGCSPGGIDNVATQCLQEVSAFPLHHVLGSATCHLVRGTTQATCDRINKDKTPPSARANQLKADLGVVCDELPDLFPDIL